MGVSLRMMRAAACQVKTDAFVAACVSALPLLYEVCCKIDKRRTRPTIPGARASLGVSAGGLGGTRALALFMVCEKDLRYDPAHPWPPMALMQSGVWSVLQHLKELEKTVRMKTMGTEVGSRLLEVMLKIP